MLCAQGEIEAVLLPLFRAEAAKFVAAGREDRDVRMLGSGRPFVLQVLDPRNPRPAPCVPICPCSHAFAACHRNVMHAASGTQMTFGRTSAGGALPHVRMHACMHACMRACAHACREALAQATAELALRPAGVRVEGLKLTDEATYARMKEG
jgi:hypothetical protein